MHTNKTMITRAPRNKEAKRAYYTTLGQLLAREKAWEVKAANFGKLYSQDRHTMTVKLPARQGYTQINRYQMCERAMKLYETDELIRPCVNLIATAIFSKGQPDIRGKNETLVQAAQDIIEDNDLNFHDIAREGELCGDVFLYYEKANTPSGIKISSLDASVVESILDNGDVRKVSGYAITNGQSNVLQSANNLLKDNKNIPKLSVNQTQHLKFNSTSTSQYGRSSLRHIIYFIDVKDKLFEENWLRGAQYYGNPLIAVTGVPGPYQANVKNQIEGGLQRAGKSWILPPETKIEVPSFALDYPIGDIVGWVFRMISIGSEIPITLLGSADAASRGSAFYANPRLELAIRPKREVWRIGLRRFLLKVLASKGLIKYNELVPKKDFDIGFLPIFERDLTDIADVVAIYRASKIMSRKTAMELIGVDASEEEEQIEAEMELEKELMDNMQPEKEDRKEPLSDLKDKQAIKRSMKKSKDSE